MAGKELSRTLGLAGSGIGVVAFLIFGLMQGALIGGTAGLQASGYIPGASGDVLSRIFAAAGMLAGVIISATMFISSGFAAGRLLGYAIGDGAAVKKGAEVPKAAHN